LGTGEREAGLVAEASLGVKFGVLCQTKREGVSAGALPLG
jgi:hypothetical protein